MDRLLQELEMFLQSEEKNFNRYVNETLEKIKLYEQVCLYGAGFAGEYVAKFLNINGIDVDYILDRDVILQGTKKKFNGREVEVIAPDSNIIDDKTAIVINTSFYVIEMLDNCKRLGYENVFFFAARVEESFSDKDRRSILSHKDELKRVLQLLDVDSRETYVNVIKTKLTCDNQYIMKDISPLKEIYFDKELMKFGNNEIFIDAGVLNGEDSKRFMELIPEYEKIFMFELDPKNYDVTCGNFTAYKDVDRIMIENKGLSNENKLINISSNGAFSTVGCDGSSKAELIRLDDYLNKEQKVTFIKMDIEGSEKAALMGSKEIIQKYHPKLAICLYHKPCDLWEIPLLIKSYDSSYKLYVRHYSASDAETVLYAI